ncbi:MAG TPA: SNF2-related protein [Blastocatellia bacterium]|nr:SNF2-related protein [Blastocatellia bacterium]
MTTQYHSTYYAHELTKRNSSDDLAKLGASLFNATVDLNPHQLDAALFAFNSPLSSGAILADEVGLGKTIEAGLIISQLWAERRRRILVITPTTLRKQWAQELADKFFLSSRVIDTAEYNKLIRDAADPLNTGEVVICSYNFAASRSSEIRATPWDLVVIDEAHRLRNVYKLQNKIANAIRNATIGRRKLLLTATPLQNNLQELFGLVSFLDERVFGDVKAFRARYQSREVAERDLADLRERLRTLCQRTLRRQVTEYIRFTNRIPFTQDFTPSLAEQELYDLVSEYLQRDTLHALPDNQRPLMTMILRKLMASSTFAIAGTLNAMAERLQSQAVAEILAEDFEAFTELDDEWSEGETRDAASKIGEFDPELKDEIDELKRYGSLAASILDNAKGQALLKALDEGFGKLASLGAARKAVIFTESRRTQDYLVRLLEDHGYAGRIVTINGTNADDRAGTIYKGWLERHEGEPVVTGNKSVDLRAAIVEHFRDHADLLIATEAAAEGVNLQFCSLVVNYDLPWNPQRIEQRIGRCHRYGQKHDVVVINFLNRKNAADQRVFELLAEKFSLFDGVFGSSDEVLGALESGVDFERRIADIYQTCRTKQQIDAAFAELQRELEEQITQRMAETQRNLFEHFDEEVRARLRLRQEEGRRYLDRFGRCLWKLTKQEVNGAAKFDDKNYLFKLGKLDASWPKTPAGKYQLLVRGSQEGQAVAKRESDVFSYRLGHPLAEAAVDRARSRKLLPAEVVFDYTAYRAIGGAKIGEVENMVGERGWLTMTMLRVASFEEEERLLCAMVDDAGRVYDPETGDKLFQVDGRESGGVKLPKEQREFLDKRLDDVERSEMGRIDRRNEEFFKAEMEKLERWADDLKFSLESEIKEIDAQLKEAKKEARLAHDMQAKLNLHRRVKELETERNQKRRRLYEEQDAIDERKGKYLDETAARLQKEISREEVFTIRWRVE